MKSYPVYKKSEIRWIGNIPNHWEVIRVKHSDIVIMGQSPNSNDYNLEEIGLPFLQGNADFTKLHPRPRVWCDTANAIAEKDDVLVSVRAPIGSVNIADQAYGIGRGLCAIRSNSTLSTLLFYFFIALNVELNSIGTGSTYTAISVDDVKNTHILKIPLPEQHAIADFIDRKTAQIDSLIEKKQRQIKLLQEHRTVLINRAVTKGLNPDVPMKDVDNDWVHTIPENWQFAKVSHFSELRTGGTPRRNVPEYWEYGTIQWMTSGEVNQKLVYQTRSHITALGLGNSNANVLPENSVMMALSGQGKTKATVAILKTFAACSQSLAAFLCDEERLHYRYLYYYLDRNYKNIRGLVGDNLRDGLSLSKLRDFRIPIPTITEQHRIADFLDTKSNQIDLQMEKITKQITYWKEYRTTLISAAVTGKIDVHGEGS